MLPRSIPNIISTRLIQQNNNAITFFDPYKLYSSLRKSDIWPLGTALKADMDDQFTRCFLVIHCAYAINDFDRYDMAIGVPIAVM